MLSSALGGSGVNFSLGGLALVHVLLDHSVLSASVGLITGILALALVHLDDVVLGRSGVASGRQIIIILLNIFVGSEFVLTKFAGALFLRFQFLLGLLHLRLKVSLEGFETVHLVVVVVNHVLEVLELGLEDCLDLVLLVLWLRISIQKILPHFLNAFLVELGVELLQNDLDLLLVEVGHSLVEEVVVHVVLAVAVCELCRILILAGWVEGLRIKSEIGFGLLSFALVRARKIFLALKHLRKQIKTSRVACGLHHLAQHVDNFKIVTFITFIRFILG